jgi:hypothetical protein
MTKTENVAHYKLSVFAAVVYKPWRRMRKGPPKRWQLYSNTHDVISRTTGIFGAFAVETSNFVMSETPRLKITVFCILGNCWLTSWQSCKILTVVYQIWYYSFWTLPIVHNLQTKTDFGDSVGPSLQQKGPIGKAQSGQMVDVFLNGSNSQNIEN